ncbi:MAG TPA: glycoside hydrolase family 57 protein [Candidatus Deferrimicrobiaceae bacterium]
MRLKVCFLWHMHQPSYKDPESGNYILPWVRLHAIKDYVALPRIFSRFPKVRHTFNLVPSLLLQIRDYVENGAVDTFLTVSRKDALDLSGDEEAFILRNFFSAFPPTMIFPQPRYEELYTRREDALSATGKNGAVGGFGASDFIDLVTLFNLTWFHPLHREEDAELSRLWQKGRDYTEKEKNYVLDRQLDVMATLIPEYRKYAEECGGELSTTPMYHPILPLLIDNRSARDAVPNAPLPTQPFSYPIDARIQLEKGRAFFKDSFGRIPDGLWPSEGSISPAMVDLAVKTGFKWAATDEMLLSRSLGRSIVRDADGVPSEPDWLYRPYQAETPSGSMAFFFRDHHLSDLIGFEYSRWNAVDAANNFIHKLEMIKSKLSSVTSDISECVVPVILDGENAWEYYYDSGRLFLETLMSKLNDMSDQFECTTFTEALTSHGELRKLPSIPTGSWIDGTFYIWIGHDEDRAAWDMLSRARTAWQAKSDGGNPQDQAPAMVEAFEHLLVAEGSDWCWWYGDDHYTPHGQEFDAIFRHHIKAMYYLIGIKPPENIDIPILKESKIPSVKNFLASPRSYISPRITGFAGSYFDWNGATRYIPMPEFGAMHRAGFGLLSVLFYGFSRSDLFLRVDLHASMVERDDHFSVEYVFPGKNRKIVIEVDPGSKSVVGRVEILKNRDESDIALESELNARGDLKFGFGRVLEAGIPFAALDCEGEDRIEFFVSIHAQGNIGERWPMYGTFTADLPGADFEERMWQI